jgi:ribosomal protein L16 Arg81 hydroxylase
MKLGFKDLISPITVEDFHRNYWDVKFCHLAGQSDRFSHLLTWNALNLILAHTESLQHLHIVKDGKPIDQPSYVKNGVVAAAKLTGHLREGATLIFNRISEVHRPISDIAEEIGRALLCDVSVNLYAAWKTSHGFDVHWDDHDVIILQIHGDKHWQIYGAVENRFAQKGSAAANGFCHPPDPIWERTLRPGEVLYIPRGWWHFARPCDHAVAHLTVGLRPPSGDSFLRWMAKQAAQRPELRRHVPLVSDELLEKYIAAMKEALTEMLADSELGAKYRRWYTEQIEVRPRFSLPHAVDMSLLQPGARVRILAAPRGIPIQASADPSEIAVSFDGSVYTFDAATLPLFQFIDQRKNVTLAELCEHWVEEFDQPELLEFIRLLSTIGVIGVEDLE